MKRTLFILIVITLCLSVFSGCNLYVTNKGDETQPPNDSTAVGTLIPKHKNDCNNIDQQLASEIKTAYCQYTNKVNYGGEQKFKPGDICILRYDGEVGGCHFVMLGGDEIDYTDAKRNVEVAEYVVMFESGQPLYAYTDGNFYTLKQAYDNGILTDNDIYKIGTRMDPSFLDRYPSSTTSTNHTIPAMAIENGYSVVASETLSIPVIKSKVKTNHTARVAALRNDRGDNALYFDVLSADNKILSSITWTYISSA